MTFDRRRARIAAAGALAAAAAVAVVVLAVTAPSPRHAPPPPSPSPSPRPGLPPPSGQSFGVNVNLLFNDFSYPAAQINAQLAAVRSTGATVARSDALWEAAEPQAPAAGHHRYDWRFDDEIAGSLAANGLTWLPILDYSAPWAQSIPGVDHSPPSSDVDYAAYAGAFASRYGPGGSFWRAHPQITPQPVTTIEIWNEPDQPEFWKPAPNPGAYAALYLAARAAIDAADPGIRVIVGGLTDPRAFLPELLQAAPRLRARIDGVAIHPYGRPATVLSKVVAARATLDSLGLDRVPLYVTEFGWTTSPPGASDYVPAARRPADIESTLTALGRAGCGLAMVVLYTWVTPGGDPGDSQNWYGIANPTQPADGTAGTAALTAGVRAASRTPGAASTACR
ncbi:MAG TPA: hypothetical protein VG371_12660 [Solirubrobacteraceae bacterium]|jgi:hypothetical protein|nr:hypothetical protein [Solirubrobacteraceae bacterium]